MSGVSASALIMVVSRPEAVEVAVRNVRPSLIGVMVSQEVVEDVVERCIGLRHEAEFSYGIVDSPMEIGDSFDRFAHLLSRIESEGYAHDDTLLDATGGTTPMRLGAALAAMTRGIRMVHQRVPQRYADGRWERDESREIEVVAMDNPLESTGLLGEGQAFALFDRRDYLAAALVLEDVVGKVSGVARRYYYEGLLLLARSYAAWDTADYGSALEDLRQARQRFEVGFSDRKLAARARDLRQRIGANLSFLGRVRGRLSVENVVDMLENARRRIVDQGRYDDGVARLYRCLEMWHQWRLLENHSIATSGTDWTKVEDGVKDAFLARTGLDRLPGELDLSRARALDLTLSGEELEDDNVYRDLLRQRNHSILAHGLEPIGEAAAKRFLEYVDELVNDPATQELARHIRLTEV